MIKENINIQILKIIKSENIDEIKKYLDKQGNFIEVSTRKLFQDLIKENDVIKYFNFCIQAGWNISSEKERALYVAIEESNLELVKLLVGNGANIHKRYDFFISYAFADINANESIIDFLINKGMTISLGSILKHTSIIEWAKNKMPEDLYKNYNMLSEKKLIEIIDLNYQNKDFLRWCLRCAVEKNYINVIKYMRKYNFDLLEGNSFALRLAAKNGNLSIVKYIHQQGGNLQANHNYAFKWSVKNNHLNVVKYLINNGVDIGLENNYALKKGFREQSTKVLNCLLKNYNFKLNLKEKRELFKLLLINYPLPMIKRFKKKLNIENKNIKDDSSIFISANNQLNIFKYAERIYKKTNKNLYSHLLIKYLQFHSTVEDNKNNLDNDYSEVILYIINKIQKIKKQYYDKLINSIIEKNLIYLLPLLMEKGLNINQIKKNYCYDCSTNIPTKYCLLTQKFDQNALILAAMHEKPKMIENLIQKGGELTKDFIQNDKISIEMKAFVKKIIANKLLNEKLEAQLSQNKNITKKNKI